MILIKAGSFFIFMLLQAITPNTNRVTIIVSPGIVVVALLLLYHYDDITTIPGNDVEVVYTFLFL